MAARVELRADRRDRPLATFVAMDERPAGRLDAGGRVNDHTAGREPFDRTSAELIVPEDGEEMRLLCQLRQLKRCYSSAATDLVPVIVGVDDVPAIRDAFDSREPQPLDVPDDGHPHRPCLPQSTSPEGTRATGSSQSHRARHERSGLAANLTRAAPNAFHR